MTPRYCKMELFLKARKFGTVNFFALNANLLFKNYILEPFIHFQIHMIRPSALKYNWLKFPFSGIICKTVEVI